MILKKVILLIEDNEDIRESIAEILELEGYHIITATCGSTGLSLAEQHIPDLVICDIVMSDMDGYSVYNSLKVLQRQRVFHLCFLRQSQKILKN